MPIHPDEEFFGPNQEQRRATEVVHYINRLVDVGIETMPNTGARVTLASACAVPGLSMVALALGKERESATIHVNTEMTVFGAIYLICSMEDYGKGMICGFSPENVTKAQAMFKMVMGREYTDIHPNLAKMIEERAKEAEEVPDLIKRFMPH